MSNPPIIDDAERQRIEDDAYRAELRRQARIRARERIEQESEPDPEPVQAAPMPVLGVIGFILYFLIFQVPAYLIFAAVWAVFAVPVFYALFYFAKAFFSAAM